MGTVNAYCVVAHPDDCLIFARPYIDHHPEYNWTIVYLTYHASDDRAKEMISYWSKRGVDTHFLGFTDHYQDNETKEFNFWDPLHAEHIIRHACEWADLILTHNADGDYGHIHHSLVHGALCQLDKEQVYFASTFNYNTKYIAKGNLSLNEFPLHRDVLEQFNDINCGLYITNDK